jgi:endonuclease G
LVKAHDICNDNYAVKYSGLSRTPLVASERITKASIEQAAASGARSNDFRPDPRLSADERSELADYKGYIYVDRGHNAPHGDMPTPVAGSQSFFLSNMIPQAACHNEGLWERIETGVRTATGAGDASDPGRQIYVATGPAFIGETVQLLNGRVSVPSHMWKAVYIPEKGTVGVYWTQNKNTRPDGQPLSDKDVEVISINELQKRTGIDVFPSITDPKLRNMAQVPPIAAQARFGCRVHEHTAAANDLTTTKDN